MVDSEVPEPARKETWLTVMKDMSLGAAIGLTLATFCLILAALAGNEGNGLRLTIKGCGLIVVLIASVAAGAVLGFLVGDGVGAVCGGAVGYGLSFAVYGAWVQRTIGWKAWFLGANQGRNPTEKNKPQS